MNTAARDRLNMKSFTSWAENSNEDFWRAYCLARPSPDEDFFERIAGYHAGKRDVAHDVATGPANIAARLARYFGRVVGSDVNESALAAAPALLPTELVKSVSFVKSAAEDLASMPLSVGAGLGETDLVAVGEAIPLIDHDKALNAFHKLLRPGGTLAIYFYGRPFFTDGDAEACNAVYERIATRIASFYLPYAGTPGEPFHRRSSEALISYLDNIAIPGAQWNEVERHKWNNNRPLLFNSKEGYDFELVPVDRRGPHEREFKYVDDAHWAKQWDLEQVKKYLASNYPKHREAAGDRYSELDTMYEELEAAMGGAGSVRRVSFPVVLILARKK